MDRWHDNALCSVTFRSPADGSKKLAAHILNNKEEYARLMQRERRVRLAAAILCFVLIPLLGLLAMQVARPPRPARLVGSVCIGGVLYALGTATSYTRTAWIRQLQRTARSARASEPLVRVSVVEEGIVWSNDKAARSAGWIHIDRVDELDGDVAFIFADCLSGMLIPASSFASPAEAETFLKKAQEAHRASGQTGSDRVVAQFAQYGYLCDRCGHDLSNLPVPVCPECGRRFTPLSLKLMDHYRRHWVIDLVRGMFR